MVIPSVTMVAVILLNLVLAMLADRGVYLPTNVELPLSSMGDFVEAADGTVLVQVSFFQRLQRYSASGRFLGAWNGLPARVSLLSMTREGDLTACLRSSLLVFDQDGKILDRKTTPIEGPTAWVYLGEREFEARAVARPGASGGGGRLPAPPAPTAPVREGEAVCTYWQLERQKTSFQRQAGGELIKKGDRILVFDEEGQLEGEVASPWYLVWCKVFWPGVPLAALSVLLLAMTNRLDWRRKTVEGQGDSARLRRKSWDDSIETGAQQQLQRRIGHSRVVEFVSGTS